MINTVRLSLLHFAFCILPSSAIAEPPKTLLLLGQKPDGHPPGTHEYLPGQRILQHLLKDVPGLKVELVSADDPWSEGPELLEKVDGVVLFVSQGGKWIQADPRRYEAFTKLAQRGGGFTGLHWGTGTKQAEEIAGYTRLVGACHGGPDRKFKVFDEIAVSLPVAEHPICGGLKPFTIHEEFYFQLKRPEPGTGTLTPLVTIPVDGTDEMVGWAFERTDGGRSFGYTGLHFHENWERPEYRRLIAQGVLWTMKLPVPEGAEFDVSAELLKLE